MPICLYTYIFRSFTGSTLIAEKLVRAKINKMFAGRLDSKISSDEVIGNHFFLCKKLPKVRKVAVEDISIAFL